MEEEDRGRVDKTVHVYNHREPRQRVWVMRISSVKVIIIQVAMGKVRLKKVSFTKKVYPKRSHWVNSAENEGFSQGSSLQGAGYRQATLARTLSSRVKHASA